jgi:hypothetical protein
MKKLKKIILIIILLFGILLIPIKVSCGGPFFTCATPPDENGLVSTFYEVEPLGIYIFELIFGTDGVIKYHRVEVNKPYF